jgi:glycosyltransferase involved in cell wall biosynthesis
MGGAEYQTHLVAEELARRPGVTVHYLARRIPSSNSPLLPYNVRAIGSGAGIRRRAVFFDAFSLDKALMELRPDAIYQRMKQSYTAVCAWRARKLRVPFFFHVASEGDLTTAWLPSRLSLNSPFDLVESATGNWGIRHANRIIVQTDRQSRLLRERFARSAAAVVRNFQPLPAQLQQRPAGPLQVLWVGNIKEVKRPELYLELAESMSDRPDIHFHMVGRPWHHRRATPIMQKIAQLPNLTYHGELSIAAVSALMSAATFYVNTSSYEGFPNTFIQAWAGGAIVLSLVVDPYDGMQALGIGFRTGTLAAMRRTIDELSRLPDRRQEIARHSFEFAHKHHSPAEGARLADLILEAAGA